MSIKSTVVFLEQLFSKRCFVMSALRDAGAAVGGQ